MRCDFSTDEKKLLRKWGSARGSVHVVRTRRERDALMMLVTKGLAYFDREMQAYLTQRGESESAALRSVAVTP